MTDSIGVLRCTHCPADAGLPCEGLKVRRFCELVDPDHSAFNPDYVPLLQDLARQAAASAETTESSGNGRSEPDLQPLSTSGLGVSESLALLEKMKACPHRSARADCGCAGAALCALGRGRNGVVNHRDCFACLRADDLNIKNKQSIISR